MTQPPPGEPPGKPSRAQRRAQRWQAPDGAPPVPTPVPSSPSSVPPPGQSPYGQRPAQPAGPSPPGGYGQFTFPQMPEARFDPVAVVGVITSVLGLPGVILGLVSLPRVRGGRRRSPALAVTAIVVGSIFTIAWTLVLITLALTGTFDRLTEQPVAGDVQGPRAIASANLAEGNCILTLPPARPVGDVQVVPCAQEHIAQVVSAHTRDGEYPGEEGLEEQASQLCTEQVQGLDGADIPVSPWYLIPTDEGWQEGNTTILCLARGDAGPYEGDLVN